MKKFGLFHQEMLTKLTKNIKIFLLKMHKFALILSTTSATNEFIAVFIDIIFTLGNRFDDSHAKFAFYINQNI